MPARTPLVYLDASIFLHVVRRRDEHPDLVADATKMLRAVERGDIRLAASRLLAVEIGRWRGDRTEIEVDQVLLNYLEQRDTEWVEVDFLVSRDARTLSWEHQLFTADAVHLATAVRRTCDYFVSTDKAFPFEQRLGETLVVRPRVLWNPTIDDIDT